MSETTNGSLLDKRYRLGEPLGRGSAGTVYRGHDVVADRSVAIKRYDGGHPLVHRHRFWRWARIAHPNLVRLLDVGNDPDGRTLVVMELAPGEDLARAAGRRRLSAAEVRDAVRDVARGLAHLHAAGLIHGDVKPGNCVWTDAGVRLLDGGEGDLGTLRHLRPQRAHGLPPAPADDLHALGVLGLTLLAGAPGDAIDGPERMAARARALGGEVAALAEILAGLLEGAIPTAAALLRALGEPEDGPAPARPALAPFVGRHEVLRMLEEVEAACLLVGVAGVGKSRLAHEALRRRAGETPALVGQCRAEAEVALRVWHDVFRTLALACPPPAGGVAAAWLATGAFESKPELFEDLAAWLADAGEPLVLVEDLHWADQASLELFRYLAPRHLHLLATARPAPTIEPLEHSAAVRVVRVAPLDHAACTALLATFWGDLRATHPFTAWAFELTGGNPLHLCELAARFRAEVDGRGAAGLPATPPKDSPGLKAMVAGLVERLSADARELLRWGVVLGRRIPLDTLHELAGLPEAAFFAAVDELCREQLWHPIGDELAFRHDLLRESLVDFWPSTLVRSTHLAIALHLEAADAPRGRLAHHFDHAGERERAIGHYVAAGDALATQSSMGDAMAYWKRALELADPETDGDEQRRFSLRERLGPPTASVDPLLGTRILPLLRQALLAQAPLVDERAVLAADLERVALIDVVAPIKLAAAGQAPRAIWPVLYLRTVIYTALEAMCLVVTAQPAAARAVLAAGERLLPAPDHWLGGVLAVPGCTTLAWENRFGDAAGAALEAKALIAGAPTALEPVMAHFKSAAGMYQLHAASFCHTNLNRAVYDECLANAWRDRRGDMVALFRSIELRVEGMSGSRSAFDRAVLAYEQALEHSGLSMIAATEGLLGKLSGLVQQGDWEAVVTQDAAFPASFRGTIYETWFHAQRAQAFIGLRRLDEAAEAIAIAERASTSPGFGLPLARAMLAVARGDENAQALVEAGIAVDAAPPTAYAVHHLWGLRLRAVLATRRGDLDAAAAALDAALALARREDNRLQEAITWLWLGRLAPERRDDALAEAERRFGELENPHYLALVAQARAETQPQWWVLAVADRRSVPEIREGEPILQTIVAWAREAARADRAKLLLVDADGGVTTSVSLAAEGAPPVEGYSTTVVRHVRETGQGVWVADVRADERFRFGLSLTALDLRTVICVPLRWHGRLRALLYLDRREASQAFTQADFRQVEILTGYGALALAHAEVAERELQAREREAEARLRQEAAEVRAKDREALLRQLVHDLRGPLQAIALMNMDLAYTTREQPDVAVAVAAIERQVTFMAEFLQQKLDRLAGSKGREGAPLTAALDELADRYAGACEARGLRWSGAVPPDVVAGIDRIELAQVLGNLVDNAIKVAASQVDLAATAADGWVTIVVSDDGPGWGRAEPATAGAGLGLENVRRLVREAGGWLAFGERAGGGAAVRVGLPTSAWGQAPGRDG